MSILLKDRSNILATAALMISVFAILFAVSMQSTPCAFAQSGSCSVGDTEQFAGDIAFDSGTAFTYTLEHSATANRTVSLPDTSVTTGAIMAGVAVDSLGILPIGTAAQVLTVDSAETTGMKWATPGTVKVATGQYTGDGTTSQAVTGVGFQVVYVVVTADGEADNIGVGGLAGFAHTGTVADNNSGWEFGNLRHNAFPSLDADGFTVSDDSGDSWPNTNTKVYNYLAFGN